jgi:hypothetical protein
LTTGLVSPGIPRGSGSLAPRQRATVPALPRSIGRASLDRLGGPADFMSANSGAARNLAAAFLDGSWSLADFTARQSNRGTSHRLALAGPPALGQISHSGRRLRSRQIPGDLDLCARLSTGQPFPDGSPRPGPSSSIVLDGEDNAGPRALQIGDFSDCSSSNVGGRAATFR